MNDYKATIEAILVNYGQQCANGWGTSLATSTATASLLQLLTEARAEAKKQLLAIGKERAEADPDYQLWAFVEDMEVSLERSEHDKSQVTSVKEGNRSK